MWEIVPSNASPPVPLPRTLEHNISLNQKRKRKKKKEKVRSPKQTPRNTPDPSFCSARAPYFICKYSKIIPSSIHNLLLLHEHPTGMLTWKLSWQEVPILLTWALNQQSPLASPVTCASKFSFLFKLEFGFISPAIEITLTNILIIIKFHWVM